MTERYVPLRGAIADFYAERTKANYFVWRTAYDNAVQELADATDELYGLAPPANPELEG